MYLLPENCTQPSPTVYEFDRIYVVLAVATATLSFYLNLSQFIVILHQRLLKKNKNIIVINLCVSGQLSSFTVIWYIYKVIDSWQEAEIVDSYLLCFLLPSGLHLLTLFTFTPLITLLVLQHHMVTKPRTCNHVPKSHFVIALLVVLAWCEAIIISIIPLTGWNNWKETCSVPHVWSPEFSALICIIYFLHYPMVLILLADLFLWSSKRRRAVCPETAVAADDSSSDNLACSESSKSSSELSLKSVVVLFIMYVMGTLPFICYTAATALHQDTDLCQSLVANERAAMWTSWVTVVFAAIRPLYQTVIEDDIGAGTAVMMTSLCRRRGKGLS